jgi:hypothetical protein
MSLEIAHSDDPWTILFTSQTHRTLSSLTILGSIARPLLKREHFPSGGSNVAQLLLLALPGIDVNDPIKSLAAVHFVCCVATCLPISDATKYSVPDSIMLTEDDEACRLQTSFFEEWFSGFIRKILQGERKPSSLCVCFNRCILTKFHAVFEQYPDAPSAVSAESGLSSMLICEFTEAPL